MTEDQEQAHNALHGQTLLKEWQQRNALNTTANRLRIECVILGAEGDKMYASNRYGDGDALYNRRIKLRAESDKLRAKAYDIWAQAIVQTFGDVLITWSGDTCTVAGETYTNLSGEKS